MKLVYNSQRLKLKIALNSLCRFSSNFCASFFVFFFSFYFLWQLSTDLPKNFDAKNYSHRNTNEKFKKTVSIRLAFCFSRFWVAVCLEHRENQTEEGKKTQQNETVYATLFVRCVLCDGFMLTTGLIVDMRTRGVCTSGLFSGWTAIVHVAT